MDLEGLAPQVGAERLTMTGTKIESLDVVDLSAIVVGRVLEQRPHPGARNPLWIHQVDVGEDRPRQIIAGAPNAVAGTLVPVALPGTVVPNGKAVRDGKIAGEAAQGMLCSAEELKLGDPERAIMLLAEGEPGESLSKYFPTDAVLVAEITPNRPDCLGHLGIARELAAATGRDLKVDFMPPFSEGADPPASDLVGVTIEAPELCARYIGAPVTGVQLGTSPGWLQRRLRAAGVRPISNVVDVTAYVMLEYGQPLHAFDLRRLGGPEIRVRRARPGERLLCLDGQERNLDERMLVIADSGRPVAIAGVIGGEDSRVAEGTADVLIESANFDPVSIRATSRALALRTEASSRFEKGLPPELAQAGARRAAQLMRQLAGGTVHREWRDEYPRPQEPVRVRTDPERVGRIIGASIAPPEQESILRRLGFQVTPGMPDWDVLVPVFRGDVELVEDIAEEIARVFGVENVTPTLPGRRQSRWSLAGRDPAPDAFREILLGAGFDELFTPALVSGRRLERLGLAAGAIRIGNPMSEDWDTMRPSLIPSLLAAAAINRRRGAPQAAFFELARVYQADPGREDGLADERERLTALLLAGADPDAGRAAFLRLKAVADRLFHAVGAPAPDYAPARPGLFHPGRTASVGEVGVVGELHPATLAEFELEGRAAVLDVDLEALLRQRSQRKARPLPRFPAVERDLAVIVPDGAPAAALMATIQAAGGPLLESARAFDEYRGGQVPTGHRSLAFALTFRSPERTLTDAEVDQELGAVRRRLAAEHGTRER